MANERLKKIRQEYIDRILADAAAEASAQIEQSIRQHCDCCGRGGVNQPLPTVEDLEALCRIRDGFDGLRKDFSPQMKDQFDRFDRTINYIHIMIAGSSNEV